MLHSKRTIAAVSRVLNNTTYTAQPLTTFSKLKPTTHPHLLQTDRSFNLLTSTQTINQRIGWGVIGGASPTSHPPQTSPFTTTSTPKPKTKGKWVGGGSGGFQRSGSGGKKRRSPGGLPTWKRVPVDVKRKEISPEKKQRVSENIDRLMRVVSPSSSVGSGDGSESGSGDVIVSDEEFNNEIKLSIRNKKEAGNNQSKSSGKWLARQVRLCWFLF